MFMKFLFAIVVLLLPAMAEAADITGIAKVREGDHVQIGNARIRLGGIDAPSLKAGLLRFMCACSDFSAANKPITTEPKAKVTMAQNTPPSVWNEYS